VKYKTLDNIDVKGKRVLVRCDLNSEIIDGKVIDSERFRESSRTIKELIKKGAGVVVMAHQGKPKKKDFLGFKQHSKILNKYVKIQFVDDIIRKKAVNAIKRLRDGQAILLDNVRFAPSEFDGGKDNQMVKTLAPLFDYYVNDAFSVSHREQTSVTGFPQVLPSVIGRLAEREIMNLEKIKMKNCLYLLGGAKAEDVIELIDKKNVAVGGTLSCLCWIAKGVELGKEKKVLRDDLGLLPKIKKELHHLILPKDFAVNVEGKRKELDIDEFPSKYIIKDIGGKTIEDFVSLIMKAECVFMKGTPGIAEKENFSKGTEKMLKAIEKSNAFSVLGGGSTSAAVDRFNINKKKIGYVSLSGGATMYYIAGKKLVGLEVLK